MALTAADPTSTASPTGRMTPSMRYRLNVVGVWSFVVAMGVLLVAWLGIAQLIPPPPPTKSAEDIARGWTDDSGQIRVGLAIVSVSAWLFLPIGMVIARQVRRIEGEWGPLSLSMVTLGVFTPLLVMIVPIPGIVAAYRADRDPEITRAFNDVFWLCFVGLVGSVVAQAVLLATATFADRGAEPVFPRWFGYVNVWYALMAVLGGCVMIVDSGPLAWNGLISFWMDLTAFCAWSVCWVIVLLRALARERNDLNSAP